MRRPDNEPMLFDLPLDRPSRDGDPAGEGEPEIDRQPARPPRTPAGAPRSGSGGSRTAAEPGLSALAPGSGQAGAAPAATASRQPRDRSRQPAGQPDPAEFAEPRRQAASTAPEPRKPTEAPAAAVAEEADGRVSIGRRVAAGAADLLVHLAVAVLALAGCRYLGVFPVWRDWPAGAVFLLSFSFLYTVVPLAFWGHTLGMTWAGLTTESAAGEPLSFDQTARRWLGALLTLVTLGLPLLLALGGRSLADRLSGSRTLATPG